MGAAVAGNRAPLAALPALGDVGIAGDSVWNSRNDAGVTSSVCTFHMRSTSNCSLFTPIREYDVTFLSRPA